ncbi:MAG: YceI family protein [Pseudomonadota bacterium]
MILIFGVLYAPFGFLSLQAHAHDWQINHAKSTLKFQAKTSDFEIEGWFEKWGGSIIFDPHKPELSMIDIQIEMDSFKTDTPFIESYLANASWFDLAQFKYARYDAKQFIKQQDDTWIIKGILSLKGYEREVPLKAKIIIIDNQAKVNGSTDLNRLDFNIGDNEWRDTSHVENKIGIVFFIEATIK